ncbi:hypothetical protein LY76DRAFT_77316 [Colletotrichum caudatum]|nr:hypothetical protein LY76DRAFT_77316 [Colletotrichum caudatum]
MDGMPETEMQSPNPTYVPSARAKRVSLFMLAKCLSLQQQPNPTNPASPRPHDASTSSNPSFTLLLHRFPSQSSPAGASSRPSKLHNPPNITSRTSPGAGRPIGRDRRGEYSTQKGPLRSHVSTARQPRAMGCRHTDQVNIDRNVPCSSSPPTFPALPDLRLNLLPLSSLLFSSSPRPVFGFNFVESGAEHSRAAKQDQRGPHELHVP